MLQPHEIANIDTAVITPQEVLRRVETLRRNRNSSASAFADCAQAFFSFRMVQEAFDAYNSALERDNESLLAFMGRAQAGYALTLLSEDESERRNLATQVVSDFRGVLKITNGESREAVLGLGSALLVANKFAECSDWIERQLRDCSDKKHEGDLLYLFALCRLFSGDTAQAVECADKMERVAGFDTERFFISALVSWLRGERDELFEYRAALQRRDEKLTQVLGAIESGASCGTFLELARLLA